MDPPLPLPVTQESRLDQETAQLVFSIPHRLCRRMEDGEMVCGALGPRPLTTPHSTQHLLPITPMGQRGWVLLEDTLPCAVQATIDLGGHRDELVCPPLARNGGADMVCGSVLTSHLSYEEESEVVCGGVGEDSTDSASPDKQHKRAQQCGVEQPGSNWNPAKHHTPLHTTTAAVTKGEDYTQRTSGSQRTLQLRVSQFGGMPA